jgi:hypothetical protein
VKLDGIASRASAGAARLSPAPMLRCQRLASVVDLTQWESQLACRATDLGAAAAGSHTRTPLTTMQGSLRYVREASTKRQL